MKSLSNEDKIKLIKKYYKNSETILTLSLINYEDFNLYITLNKLKNSYSYRLSFFNLDDIESVDVGYYLSCTYIRPYIIDNIKEDFKNFIVDSNYEEELNDTNIVILESNISTKVNDSFKVSFNNYLPKSLTHLLSLFIFIFDTMPNSYREILFELLASLTNNKEKYEYKKEFDFDLFNDDINSIFRDVIIKRGIDYYKSDTIKFLEKIDEENYYAIVEGTEDYLVIINYNEEDKKLKVYCTCPCEFYCKHIYAVLLAIKENKAFKEFYKVVISPNNTSIDNLIDSHIYLSPGIEYDDLMIIVDGYIEYIPLDEIIDNIKVLKDDQDNTLTSELMNYNIEY